MSKAIIRIAGLDSLLAMGTSLRSREADDVSRRIKLTVKDGPNVTFYGFPIADYSQNPERTRYEELVLYAVDGGGFVAARAWHSNVAGEESFWSAAEVVTVNDCMAAWEWTATAKGFAKVLQWDAVKRIGPAA